MRCGPLLGRHVCAHLPCSSDLLRAPSCWRPRTTVQAAVSAAHGVEWSMVACCSDCCAGLSAAYEAERRALKLRLPRRGMRCSRARPGATSPARRSTLTTAGTSTLRRCTSCPPTRPSSPSLAPRLVRSSAVVLEALPDAHAVQSCGGQRRHRRNAARWSRSWRMVGVLIRVFNTSLGRD